MRRPSKTGLFQSKMMWNHIVALNLYTSQGQKWRGTCMVVGTGSRVWCHCVLLGITEPFFNPPVSLPRLVDMDWRVDIKTSSDSIVRMAVPTCLLQLKVMAVAVKDWNNEVQHLTCQGKPAQTGVWCLPLAWWAIRLSQRWYLKCHRAWELCLWWKLSWTEVFCAWGGEKSPCLFLVTTVFYQKKEDKSWSHHPLSLSTPSACLAGFISWEMTLDY